jgi:hypothetical protein
LAFACSACSSVLHPLPEAWPAAIEVPFEVRHRLPTVEVKADGEPFKLFLDLGGHRGIALTTAELERAPVRFLEGFDQFRNSAGQTIKSRRFTIEHLTVGELTLEGVVGGESIFGDSVPPERNGYIGMPILGRYLLVFSYREGRLRLYKSGDDTALRKECGDRSFRVSLAHGIAQSVGTTELGTRLFLWDTGATTNSIRRSSLPADAALRRIDDGPPIVTLRSVRLDEVELGPLDFRVIEFAAPAVDAYLGADLFETHKVCLDINRGIGAAEPNQ